MTFGEWYRQFEYPDMSFAEEVMRERAELAWNECDAELAALRERVKAQDVLLRRVVAAFCLPSDSLAVPVTPDEVSKVVRDVMAALAQPPAGGAT